MGTSQPHLSQRYCRAPAGLGLPHSAQNLPLFTVPQEQVQPSVSTGLGLPHSGQNLPLTVAPQEHFHALVGVAGAAGAADRKTDRLSAGNAEERRGAWYAKRRKTI